MAYLSTEWGSLHATRLSLPRRVLKPSCRLFSPNLSLSCLALCDAHISGSVPACQLGDVMLGSHTHKGFWQAAPTAVGMPLHAENIYENEPIIQGVITPHFNEPVVCGLSLPVLLVHMSLLDFSSFWPKKIRARWTINPNLARHYAMSYE